MPSIRPAQSLRCCLASVLVLAVALPSVAEGADASAPIRGPKPTPFGDTIRRLVVQTPGDVEVHAGQRGGVVHDLSGATRTFASDAVHIYTAPTRINGRTALWTAGILAVGGLMYAYDQEIHDELKRFREKDVAHPLLDFADDIEAIGDMGKTNRYYFATLALSYVFRAETVTTVTAQILESHFIAGGVKNLANVLVGRRRPHDGQGPYSFKFNDGTSFPSGHSSNTMQLAVILSHHVDFLPFQIAAYTIATSISVQRVTSDAHWPSDSFLGAVLGYVVAREVVRLNENRKWEVRPMTAGNGRGVGFGLSCEF